MWKKHEIIPRIHQKLEHYQQPNCIELIILTLNLTVFLFYFELTGSIQLTSSNS